MNLEDKSEVVGFDAETLAGQHRWSVVSGKEPIGLALDPVHHRPFSMCGNQLAVVLNEDSPGRFHTETISSARGGRTSMLDPTTHRLYLPTAELGAPPAAPQPQPRPRIVPGAFHVLTFGR